VWRHEVPESAFCVPQFRTRPRGVKDVAALRTNDVTMFSYTRSRPYSHGPRRGSLVIQGGGTTVPAIRDRFVKLAGGPRSNVVLIPSASLEYKSARELDKLKRFGFKHIFVLHTRDRSVADSETFVAPLNEASAVWISGGRQWRLIDAYLNTLTHKALKAILDRGGVVGGTSAGASILGSYLVRGAPEGNHIVIAPGYEVGLGFLRNVAIDQHVNSRARQDALVLTVKTTPGLLGIGIDERTAIVVQRDRFEVVGNGNVIITDGTDHNGKYYYCISEGTEFDLKTRKILPCMA